MKFLTIAFISLLLLGSCDTRFIPYRAFIGPGGGTVEGPDSTAIIIPRDALEKDAEIYIFLNRDARDLPRGTERVYEVGTRGISLKKQAIFTVPAGTCNPTKWSLNGTAPWLNLPREVTNCPGRQVCAAVSVLGSIACTKGGWNEDR